ncbi:MAG: hypothetical protein ACXW3G_08745, partial [Rhodoplanes sp.]
RACRLLRRRGLGESDLSHHAAAEALPMQQVFAVLFFGEREIAVGMSDFALQRLGVDARTARSTVDRLLGSSAPGEVAD